MTPEEQAEKVGYSLSGAGWIGSKRQLRIIADAIREAVADALAKDNVAWRGRLTETMRQRLERAEAKCPGGCVEGWLLPARGPGEPTRCACNPRPATVTHRLNSIGQAWPVKVKCGKDADAWLDRNEEASTDDSAVTCRACLEKMR